MFFTHYTLKSKTGWPVLLLIPLLFAACQQKTTAVKPQPSFKMVQGFGFTEVRRTFKSGLSFSDQGFQLEPDWKLTFISDDSVNIYSPEKKKFFNCPVIFDHDSIFNVAWAWLRLKKLSKDSIKFQVLQVEDKKILDDKSVVYMTLYADSYIKNDLHTDSATLVKPSRQDTLYIKKKTAMADADSRYAFSARIPATLKSNSALLSVQKTSVTKDAANNITIADDYLTPEFNITIHKAYEDFDYPFTILIDSKGQMHFGHSTIDMSISPEFKASTERVMTAIMNGYLKHYLTVTPGTTLGIPHTSKIMVHVKGLKS